MMLNSKPRKCKTMRAEDAPSMQHSIKSSRATSRGIVARGRRTADSLAWKDYSDGLASVAAAPGAAFDCGGEVAVGGGEPTSSAPSLSPRLMSALFDQLVINHQYSIPF